MRRSCQVRPDSMINRNQHFVSQHYLRQFRIGETDTIWITKVDPLKVIGAGGIKGQCQADYFYGRGESKLDQMLREIEGHVAPVLIKIASERTWNETELAAIRMLAVELYLRTRKAAEAGKVFPRFIADQVISRAISKGELPEPEGGWAAEMMDFGGVPDMLLAQTFSLFLETGTLGFKLLEAQVGKFFITSDNPVVALNQYAADAKTVRKFVGFAQSGFQLFVPLGPRVVGFFYDPKVYKVGNARDRVVALSAIDTDLINSLQIQSAEYCVYSHDPSTATEVQRLVTRYAKLRVPLTDGLQVFKGPNPNEELVLSRHPALTIPGRWLFCTYRRHISKAVGERRDPLLTRMIEELEEDIRQNPNGDDVTERLERIMAKIPVVD